MEDKYGKYEASMTVQEGGTLLDSCENDRDGVQRVQVVTGYAVENDRDVTTALTPPLDRNEKRIGNTTGKDTHVHNNNISHAVTTDHLKEGGRAVIAVVTDPPPPIHAQMATYPP